MNWRIGFFVSLIASCVASEFAVAEQPQPKWFHNAAQATGNAYRVAVSNALAVHDVAKQLATIATTTETSGADCRQACLLLARLQYPDVFTNFEALIQQERMNLLRGERQGFLSGMLLFFAKSGPESRFVDEAVRDENGKIHWVRSGDGGTNKLHILHSEHRNVEKYTDAEVKAGIARNAAARQAVLEHFLKFLGEGSAYEQSEVLDFVYRQWGSTSFERRKDEAVADDLIEAVYKDTSRPLALRIRAASYFPDVDRKEKQAFLLNAATNTISTEIAPRDVKPHDVNVKIK